MARITLYLWGTQLYVSVNVTKKISGCGLVKMTEGLELEIVALVLVDYLLVTHVMPTRFRRGKIKWR